MNSWDNQVEEPGEDAGVVINVEASELEDRCKSLEEQYEDVEENMSRTFTSACDDHDKFTGLPFEYLGRSQREGYCGGVQPLFRVKFSSGDIVEAMAEEVSSLYSAD